MGGTSSTRRVTFEADENENITVVKGIRLSENVIDRMKEASPSGSKSQRYSGAYGASVSDEELKRRVAEELALEQAKKESEHQKRLKQGKDLERERALANEQLTRAILRERVSSEEERVKAKHLAKLLEEKDRVIKRQDAFYKEQLARLEERAVRGPSSLCGPAGQDPPVLPPERPADPQLLCSGRPVHALRQPGQAERD
ncbi:MICOS complex subunit MIC19 isoform X4 [Desmodus rotundus]|uniref:MICOS complex subunit MIC19 isoform X4 n=1 Tax=Desmodus rotundus TaxID=9430 RepID=UPI001E1BFD06|nr:MICOS complex subunit MIC19 isoform X4 [Desmodus rotundus]